MIRGKIQAKTMRRRDGRRECHPRNTRQGYASHGHAPLAKLKPRTRHTAAFLSALAMGLGQMYNRQWVKGILLLVLEISYLGVFHDLFNMGLWGIVTLGTKPFRDHSIQLLAEGIIALILIAFGLLCYALNVRDAYRVGAMRERGFVPGRLGDLPDGDDKGIRTC